MPSIQDGPFSTLFSPLTLRGNIPLEELVDFGVSTEMASALDRAPTGLCTGWGIPFEIGHVVAIKDHAVSVDLPPARAPWLVFMHTSDQRPIESGPGGIISPMRGEGQLGETERARHGSYLVAMDDRTIVDPRR